MNGGRSCEGNESKSHLCIFLGSQNFCCSSTTLKLKLDSVIPKLGFFPPAILLLSLFSLSSLFYLFVFCYPLGKELPRGESRLVSFRFRHRFNHNSPNEILDVIIPSFSQPPPPLLFFLFFSSSSFLPPLFFLLFYSLMIISLPRLARNPNLHSFFEEKIEWDRIRGLILIPFSLWLTIFNINTRNHHQQNSSRMKEFFLSFWMPFYNMVLSLPLHSPLSIALCLVTPSSFHLFLLYDTNNDLFQDLLFYA